MHDRADFIPPPPGPPAPAPAKSSPPSRPGRRLAVWILPFCGGALAVIVVAAAVIALRHSVFAPAHRPSASTSAAAPTGPMPAEMFPNALFSALTQDINSQNETAFLRLASPHARPAMKTWWDNLNAIGFTAGAVIPTAGRDTVRIDSHGDGSTIVLAGTHSPLDPSYQGKPGVPLERYRIGLHFASPTATGQITSWQPLDSDPWDGTSGLYVQKSTNVVVAGLPGDSGVVDETVPLAQAAAAYDIGLVRQANPNDLLQEGFVVFVSGDAAVRNGWFAGDPQPAGWPLAWNGDRTFQLAGPGTSPDDYTGAPGGMERRGRERLRVHRAEVRHQPDVRLGHPDVDPVHHAVRQRRGRAEVQRQNPLLLPRQDRRERLAGLAEAGLDLNAPYTWTRRAYTR
jgi:hypothetical protein